MTSAGETDAMEEASAAGTGTDQTDGRAGGRPGLLRPYAEIYAIPRAWRFSVAGILGRMPMSMFGLGTVLLISAATGQYGLAGSVSAAGALGGAVCAPRFGRLIDRVGQHRVLVPQCLIFAVAVGGLVAAVELHAPAWTLFLCGVTGGATIPQTGPMARARWSALLGGSPRLHTAFSIESVADELCFVVGPAAVTALATQVHPAAGVGTAVFLALTGSLWFASQRSTEPPVVGRDHLLSGSRRGLRGVIRRGDMAGGSPPRRGGHRGVGPRGQAQPSRRRALAAPGLPVLVPAFVFLGMMFVTVDLSTVAFASRFGHKALAGLILGCYALGSGTGGLWYGSRTWRSPVSRRMAITLSVTAAGVCTFWAMPNLAVLAVVIYLSGMTIAPTLISGFSLLEEQALPGRSTEAMTWLSTGISVGVACGAASTGFVLDAFGPRWGYAFAAACGVTSAVIYLCGQRRVTGSPVTS